MPAKNTGNKCIVFVSKSRPKTSFPHHFLSVVSNPSQIGTNSSPVLPVCCRISPPVLRVCQLTRRPQRPPTTASLWSRPGPPVRTSHRHGPHPPMCRLEARRRRANRRPTLTPEPPGPFPTRFRPPCRCRMHPSLRCQVKANVLC